MNNQEYREALRDRRDREKQVASWRARFKRIKKKDPSRTITAICNDYGLSQTEISHKMAGRRVGEWPRILEVNAALDAEYKRLKIGK